MNITLDIILLAVLVISFVIGYKKGFVKSVWKIVALVVTIVLVLALKTPTVNFLAGSALANNISTKIAENVNIPQGGGVDIAETLNLPEFIQSDMTNQINSANNAVNSINEKTVMWLTNLCLTVIACVALCFPTTDLGPIIAAVSFGIGTCMGTITPTIAASKQFGMADLGKVTGTITSLEMVGGTVGAIVSGVLFDATGSFASTWIVCLACSVVMLVFLLASEPIAAKLRASVAGE